MENSVLLGIVGADSMVESQYFHILLGCLCLCVNLHHFLFTFSKCSVCMCAFCPSPILSLSQCCVFGVGHLKLMFGIRSVDKAETGHQSAVDSELDVSSTLGEGQSVC